MDAKDRKIEQLQRLVSEQVMMIETLVQRVDQLKRELAKARKDSSNSSKPPSSDIVKPTGPTDKRHRHDELTVRTVDRSPGQPATNRRRPRSPHAPLPYPRNNRRKLPPKRRQKALGQPENSPEKGKPRQLVEPL